jgi:ligand-binding sensor domain-containing protein/two-component sensor histidine kinase
MPRPHYVLLLIFYLGLTSAAYGAQPRISRSPLSAQIDQPIIAAVHRDSVGFLWIGTQEGLYKFDGSSMTTFNSDASNENWIPASDIRGISESIDGELLVATYGGGLIKWDQYSDSFAPVGDFNSIEKSQLTNLHVSSDGSIWVSTQDRLMLYESNFLPSMKWLKMQDLANLVGRPYVFLESSPGNLLVGGSNGLTQISTHSKNFVNYDLTKLGVKNSFGVTALALDGDGNLVLGTDSGHLAVLDQESGAIITHTKLSDQASIFVSDFVFFEDSLLIATDKGIYLSTKSFPYIKDLSFQGAGLSSSDIFTLYRDENYIWIGTYNGLYIMSFSPFELFNNRNSGLYDDVIVFEQDSSNRMWVGTYGGLYLFNKATRTHSKFEPHSSSSKLLDQRITAISSSQKLLWLGFYRGGIQAIDISNGDIHTPDIDNSNEMLVTDILSSTNNRDIWVATDNHGLLRATPDDVYYYFNSGAIPERRISLIFPTSEGRLIVSTAMRIYLYDPAADRFSSLELDFGLGDTKPLVLSIAEDRNGNFWFGTKDHGLFSAPKSNLKSKTLFLNQFENDDALKYSTIYGIEPDSNGNLWCSTQSGIVKLDENGNLIKRFSTIDGLQGDDFSLGAAFTSRTGLMYFGGANGYNRFDPNEVVIDRSTSPMKLTGISLPSNNNGIFQNATGITSLQLTHEDQFVTFQFSVLDFSHPERNQFRYQLENFDPGWIENGNRNTATYTNLPAGEYVFKVQGANSAGIWNREGITLNVRVLPAPWYSWWAICAYAVTILFLVWCGLRIYRSYAIDKKSKQLAKEMFESENRADDDIQEQLEIQDELVQSAYQHNLATLSLVSDCISYQTSNKQNDNEQELATGSIKRISALSCLEDCLYYQAGGPVVNLRKYTEIALSNLLKQSPVNPETIVTINEVSPQLLPAELASPLALVLFELLENCILHAFEVASPVNYVHIKMGLSEDREKTLHTLNLSVHDSGMGLPSGVDDFISENSGIAIVQAIVNELGGNLQFSDENGTTVSLSIPEPKIA